MSKLSFTILGCGNSTGVPAIGNFWGACDPTEPKNRRSRCSLLVQSADTNLIIDTGPDFREQLNRAEIDNISAVLYTHQHSDHVNGIDELRVLRHRNKLDRIPCFANAFTLEDLKSRFHYMFAGGNHDLYPPIIDAHTITENDLGKVQNIADIEFIPFEQDHGTCKSLGYRFDDFAYSVDLVDLDDAALETLKGVKTWVVDAAGYNQTGNPVHANLKKIYELNDVIQAEMVYLTSLALPMDYQTLLSELPHGYAPAYDGLEIR